jgi:excisionase family DNA binding protein
MDALLTTSEVAEALGVAEISLRKWRIAGAGPRFVRLGRSVRYRKAAVDAFLHEREYGSTSEADTAEAA